MLAAVLADPTLSQVPGLAGLIDQLDLLLTAANSEIRYANTAVNGVVVLEAARSKLTAIYYELDGMQAETSYYERPLKLIGKLTAKRFEVRSDA